MSANKIYECCFSGVKNQVKKSLPNVHHPMKENV